MVRIWDIKCTGSSPNCTRNQAQHQSQCSSNFSSEKVVRQTARVELEKSECRYPTRVNGGCYRRRKFRVEGANGLSETGVREAEFGGEIATDPMQCGSMKDDMDRDKRHANIEKAAYTTCFFLATLVSLSNMRKR